MDLMMVNVQTIVLSKVWNVLLSTTKRTNANHLALKCTDALRSKRGGSLTASRGGNANILV